MSTAASAPSLKASANLFQLTEAKGTTTVTYYPVAPGPIRLGQGGSLLEYSGVEGKFSFRATDVSRMDTPLGQLITVALQPTVSLTVFLPPVLMGDSRKQEFSTFCVKTATIGATQKPGAQNDYHVQHMNGLAEEVILPL